MPSAQPQGLLRLPAGNRDGALQEPMLMAGDPTERELRAPGCSAPQALPTLPTRPGWGGSSTPSNLS